MEIALPDQKHRTVIDVPGILKNAAPDLTTKADIARLHGEPEVDGAHRHSHKRRRRYPGYFKVWRQTLEPVADRTLDVLTKPDLVDQGAEFCVVIASKAVWVMKLGWHVVRNGGQQ